MLIARPGFPWGLGLLFASLAAVHLAVGTGAMWHGEHTLAALTLLVGGGFAWAVIFFAGRYPRIELSPERISFGARRRDQRSVSWAAVERLLTDHFVFADGRLFEARHRLYLTDGAQFEFSGRLRNASTVAASLQAGRYDPNARLDPSRVTVIQLDSK